METIDLESISALAESWNRAKAQLGRQLMPLECNGGIEGDTIIFNGFQPMLLSDGSELPLAVGYYDGQKNFSVRVLRDNRDETIDIEWIKRCGGSKMMVTIEGREPLVINGLLRSWMDQL